MFNSKKRFDLLDTVSAVSDRSRSNLTGWLSRLQLLAYMNAQNTFFHQGSDMCEDLEVFIKEVATQV